MFQWLFTDGSYVGIMIFLILTGAGLPIPEEVGIVFAGVGSAPNSPLDVPLDPGLAFGACLIGCLAGDSLMYGIGRFLGVGWLHHHRWFAEFFHIEREKQMERMIAQHGIKVFFVARFMVGVRGPLYVTAGILRVPFRRFLLVDLICASIVVGSFFTLSYFFGNDVLQWIHKGERWVTAIVVLAVAIVAVFLFLRYRMASRLANETPAANPGEQPEPQEAGAGQNQREG